MAPPPAVCPSLVGRASSCITRGRRETTREVAPGFRDASLGPQRLRGIVSHRHASRFDTDGETLRMARRALSRPPSEPARDDMSATASPTTITDHERDQIERANASAATPVVFIHGLWLLPSSWANWADFFQEAGYAPLTPVWPGDPETVEEARANPDVLAKKTLGQVAEHTTEVIEALDKKPAVMGHSTGGLLAEMLAGRGLSAVTVAIDPGIFRGVLPLPASVLKGVGPFLVDPRTRGRALALTFDQFKYGWANALDEKEA